MDKFDDEDSVITKKLQSLLDATVSRPKIAKLKQLQLDFFCRAITSIANPECQRNIYQDYVTESLKCFDITAFHLLEHENDNLSRRRMFHNGVLVISNHLGTNKLTKISIDEFRRSLKKGGERNLMRNESFVNNDPFMILFASMIKTISAILIHEKVKFSGVLINQAFPLSEVADACNFILISRGTRNQFSHLRNLVIVKITEAKAEKMVPVIMMFPEGGTSGKKDGKGPYELAQFHSGYLRIASELNLPVLPLVQFFNKEFKFFVKPLDVCLPDRISSLSNEEIRLNMQNELFFELNENGIDFRTR